MPSNLKVYRELDQSKLSRETIEHLEIVENSSKYVDNDRARDEEYNSEIIGATKKFAIVETTDEGPQIRATFKDLAAAEKAKASAKVVFSLELADEPADEDDGGTDLGGEG